MRFPGHLLGYACFVSISMSPYLQQAYWQSIEDEFIVDSDGLWFKQHRMCDLGNCTRCGWRGESSKSGIISEGKDL